MLTITKIALLLLPLSAWSQKKLVENNSYRYWTKLYADYAISDDGQSICYRYGAPATGDTLVILTDKKQVFPRGFNPVFQGRRCMFQLPGDTLVILDTDTTYVPGISQYIIQDNILFTQTNSGSTWVHLPSNREFQLVADTLKTAGYAYSPAIGPIHISKDGNYVVFQLPPKQDNNNERIRIWHYQDQYLQSPPPRLPVVVLNVTDKTVWPVTNDSTEICYQDGRRYILLQNILNSPEYYWNKRTISTLYLFDTHTGQKKIIARNKADLLLHAAISPDEQFITWYNAATARYDSYTISSGKTVPLMKGNIEWSDTTLYVYTEQELWKADPRGLQLPVRLAYGYEFKLLFPGIMSVFNSKTKENGFWDMERKSPVLDKALYYIPRFPLDQYKPIKAKDTAIYLVQRMSATSAPNLFITTDFINYRAITNFQPQADYNWLTAELTAEGLLYKPENFAPARRYPVIFHYYEKSSDGLHRYLAPQPGAGDLNIPWYVSHGYLVFVPDIKTETGHPGLSAAKAVVKAAKFLSAFPWVDKEHMGLQGHSFGGYITNYLVTCSNLFAAAQSSAGPADFFSGYGSIRKQTGTAMQALYEKGQNNMGVPPWQHPALYIENSPVLHVHKVTTPLLLMHNENDNAVPVAQSIEMFTALRRLQKPVWLIQYKDEGHQLFNDQNRLDFEIRQQAFFDYYLKKGPLPEWMKGH